jgi:peptide/nickel transport system permease protein
MAAADPAPASPAAPAEPAAPEAPLGDSNWAIAWRQLRKDKLAMLGLTLVLVLSGIAVGAPLLANGRPLYVRGYLTNFYDSDAAAFADWHRRHQLTVKRLRAGVPIRDQTLHEERLERYRAGLPDVLRRLAANLPGPQRKALLALRAEYVGLLEQPLERVDLPGLDALGARIEADFCALSLTSAYKRAAMPLLEVPALLDGVRDARELRGLPGATPAELQEADQSLARASAGALRVAGEVEQGILAVLSFLEPRQRDRLNQAETAARASLRGLSDAGPADADLQRVQADVHALARLLDDLADRPVPPAQQKLPLVTRWPVFRTLSAFEIAFLVLYLTFVGGLALWRWSPGFDPSRLVWAPLLFGALAWGFVTLVATPTNPPSETLYKDFARQLRANPDGVSSIVFPLVPFGENENIHADRTTPPVLYELLAAGQRKELARRLQVAGEPELSEAQAVEALDRLRSHWLGTDDNGRDILSRLIYGSRVSLSVGFVAVGIYVLIGIILGSIAGYFGGWVDALLSRITEIVMCFPSFFLIVTVMAVIQKPSIFYIMVVIGITRWTETMRLVRGEFLRLSSQDFVAAAKSLGLHPLRIVFLHVLPNAFSPVFVAAAFGVAGAILIESALSFLGFGVPQPTASWGSVLNVAFGHEKQLWWVTVFAGLLIFITVTAYNLVGEGLRDALDPKLRH